MSNSQLFYQIALFFYKMHIVPKHNSEVGMKTTVVDLGYKLKLKVFKL